MKIKVASLVSLAVIVMIGFSSAYVIDETEQVVITQFGKYMGEPITEPGLHFKWPVIWEANFFPKNLLHWDGVPGQIPTKEKTYIWVDTFARWKVTDAIKFFQTVNNTKTAMGRLDDIIDPAVRNFITSYRLIETVRTSNRQMNIEETDVADSDKKKVTAYMITTGREKITQEIMKQARPKMARFGIELVDVKIKRINYVEEVRKSVYGRMIAERRQIAEKYRSEGQGEARKILGDKERDLKEITSMAYKMAQEIKGKAEGEATKLYAVAYSRDPEFYSFVKTLDTYKYALDEKSSLIMSTDSEFLKYFKGYK